MSGTGLALIAEARRLGLAIRADGDRIKVKPAEKLPPDLAERIRANREAILAVLRSLDHDTPTADAPRCHEGDANRPDGFPDGGKRPVAKALPVRWILDDIDRRVLLDCGIIATPSPDELPPAWRGEYQKMTARMVKIGVHRERAEAIALRAVLERMQAAGELQLPEGW